MKNEKTKKNLGHKAKCLLCLSLAFILTVGSSIAYFTDHVAETANGTAGTVGISVDNNINLLNADGKDILNPGDIRDIKFSVENEGNKSVDTEIMITLTSSVPMQDNAAFRSDKSIMPFVEHGGTEFGEDPLIYSQQVYSSEYELYWADDVTEVDGMGHYPKEDALPIQNRYMNDAKTQIVYVLDGNVLSGDDSLNEQEIEYYSTSVSEQNYYVLGEGSDCYFERDDISFAIPGATNCVLTAIEMPKKPGYETLIIPNYSMNTGEKEFAEYILFCVSDQYHLGIDDDVKKIYIGSGIKNIIWYDIDLDRTTIYTNDEFEDTFGIDVLCYEDLISLINSFKTSPVITGFDYEQLSDEMKASYSKCEDNKEYDIVLLFDPNSGNNLQGSNVSIKVEVRAKQHRNTEAGWHLVDTSVNAVIQDSVFTVEYDEMRRVELTGMQDGVNKNSLTDVVVPEGVEVITADFFADCTNIRTVTLPSTVVEIQDSAFKGCSNLTTINLPEGLQSIGVEAFADCISLNNIELPDSLVLIGDFAFSGCVGLKAIAIPGSVENTGYYSFYGTGLETVVIEEGAEVVGAYCFANCSSLKNVELPDTLIDIYSEGFLNCTSLESVELPNSMKEIGYEAFGGCTALTSIVIPKNVQRIRQKAFYGCNNMTEITILSNLKSIDKNAFYCSANVDTTVHTNSNVAMNYNWSGDNRKATIIPIE